MRSATSLLRRNDRRQRCTLESNTPQRLQESSPRCRVWKRTCIRTGLDRPLLELVKLRARSSAAAPTASTCRQGRSIARRNRAAPVAVSVWRECPYCSERERAALAWTEAITLVSVDHVPDEAYELVLPHCSGKELVDLTLAIVAINGWNRLAIAFRTVPGTFQVGGRIRARRDATGSEPAHSATE